MSKKKTMVKSLGNQEIWQVLINFEDQCSIWAMRKEVPYVGREAGKKLELRKTYVKEVWTDTRPCSLKKETIKIVNSLF